MRRILIDIFNKLKVLRSLVYLKLSIKDSSFPPIHILLTFSEDKQLRQYTIELRILTDDDLEKVQSAQASPAYK